MTIDTTVKVLQVLGIGCRMCESACDLHEALQDSGLSSSQRKIRVTANAVFIGLQGAAMAAPVAGLSENLQVNLNAGAAAADIAQRASHLYCKMEVEIGDLIDFGCLTVFRITDLSRTTITLRPNWFNCRPEKVKEVADFFEAGSYVVLVRKKAYRVGEKALNYLIQYYHALTLIVPREEDLGSDNRECELRGGGEFQESISEILGTKKISDFQRIPALFIEDVTLKRFICPITQKPIRYVLAVGKEPNRVLYEKEAIRKWFKEKPSERPSRWPQGIEFSTKNLERDEKVQKSINDRLQLLIDDFQEIPLQPPSLQGRILGLAAELGLGKKANSEIADILAANRAIWGIKDISIQTAKHRFSSSSLPKVSTYIFIRTLSRGKAKENLKTGDEKRRAICALLGSKDATHL